MNKRLLVLSFHAPPDGAVGGLRWAGLSRQMALRGWNVRVITASPDAETVAVPDGMDVRSVPRLTTLQDHYRDWRRSQAPGRQSEKGSHERPRRRDLQTEPERSALRSGLADLLSFPDHGRGWILRAAGTTRREVRDWVPDAVVSTGPPHSVHLAAHLGLRGSEVPWIVDLRDPWITPWHGYTEAGWSAGLLRRLEPSVFRRAARILTTTPELRGELQEHYPVAPVEWLPNGVDTAELPSRPASLPPGFYVTHLGSVYFNRDPTPVLRAFAAFLRSNPAAATAGSKLRFVGDVSTDFRPELERVTRDLEIVDHVEATGVLPRKEALEILAGSHMALVLAQGQEVMVPAKLYEAVGIGLPTLVVTETDSATGRESRRLGAATHAPGDEAGIAASFEALWTGRWNQATTDVPRVDHGYLAAELESILWSVMGDVK